MDDEKRDNVVTVPLWALNEAMPALLGAAKVYEARMVLGNMPQPFTQADLDRFRQAITVIAEAMEHAGMTWEPDLTDR